MEKEQVIRQILDLEWPMFQAVNGAGPKASCQQNEENFRRQRTCQYAAWSIGHLQSWLMDLRDAANSGRDLITEKYARMMEKTHPAEYAAMASSLPDIDEDTLEKINEIVEINLGWKEELDREFPALMQRGRSSRHRESSTKAAFETYLRSELMTCSPATIAIYYMDTVQRLREGRSEARENLYNQVVAAGFSSLASANAHFEGAE